MIIFVIHPHLSFYLDFSLLPAWGTFLNLSTGILCMQFWTWDFSGKTGGSGNGTETGGSESKNKGGHEDTLAGDLGLA